MDEPAGVVDGEPVQQEPELLVGERPGAAVVGQEVLGAPAGNLPAEGFLREDPGAIGAGLPGGADIDRVGKARSVGGEGWDVASPPLSAMREVLFHEVKRP